MNLKKYGFREGFDFKVRFHLRTEVGEYLVSTVDLGIDHSFGIGKPLYYETMIFKKINGEVDWGDLYCERYSTEEEAKEGHQKAIDYVKEHLEEENNEY